MLYRVEGLTPIQNIEWESMKIPINADQARWIEGAAKARTCGKDRATTKKLRTTENAPLASEETGIAGECAFVTVLKNAPDYIKFDADFLAKYAEPDFKVYDRRDKWEFWDVKTQASSKPFSLWRAWQANNWMDKPESKRESVLIFARVISKKGKAPDGTWYSDSKRIEERIVAVQFLGCMPCTEMLDRARFVREGEKLGSGWPASDDCYEIPTSELYTIQSLLQRPGKGFYAFQDQARG